MHIYLYILYPLFLFVFDTDEGIESYIKPLYKEEGTTQWNG